MKSLSSNLMGLFLCPVGRTLPLTLSLLCGGLALAAAEVKEGYVDLERLIPLHPQWSRVEALAAQAAALEQEEVDLVVPPAHLPPAEAIVQPVPPPEQVGQGPAAWEARVREIEWNLLRRTLMAAAEEETRRQRARLYATARKELAAFREETRRKVRAWRLATFQQQQVEALNLRLTLQHSPIVGKERQRLQQRQRALEEIRRHIFAQQERAAVRRLVRWTRWRLFSLEPKLARFQEKQRQQVEQYVQEQRQAGPQTPGGPEEVQRGLLPPAAAHLNLTWWRWRLQLHQEAQTKVRTNHRAQRAQMAQRLREQKRRWESQLREEVRALVLALAQERGLTVHFEAADTLPDWTPQFAALLRTEFEALTGGEEGSKP